MRASPEKAPGTYELLDSGGGWRLERIGPYRVARQASHACWEKRLPAGDWDDVDGVHHHLATGGGRWEFRRETPESWTIDHEGMRLLVRLTDFGHIGLFPEQADNWRWIRERLGAAGRPAKVLNLFAYTGASTLAALAAGAQVVHVDASKGAVEWAKENARLSDVAERPVRWLVDDAQKFLRREVRRGSRYDGVVLDPPSFGRGKKGEVWKFEESLADLLRDVRALLSPEPLFVVFSCHTPGFSPLTTEIVLKDHLLGVLPRFESGEMTIPQSSRAEPYPNGVFCRFRGDP